MLIIRKNDSETSCSEWKWNMGHDWDGHEKNGYMGEENIEKDIWYS